MKQFRLIIMLALVIGLFSTGYVFATDNNQDCAVSGKHTVTCENAERICIYCTNNVPDGEECNIIHSIVLCDANHTCYFCGKAAEGNYIDILHDIDYTKAKYISAKTHEFSCTCGKEKSKEEHFVSCDIAKKYNYAKGLTCELCNGKADRYMSPHNDLMYHSAKYHWKQCKTCGEITMPKLKHYTSCLNPKNKCCEICGQSTSKITIEKKYKGLHAVFDIFDGSKASTITHAGKCLDCGKVVIKKHKVQGAKTKYTYVNKDLHNFTCSCGEKFKDYGHLYKTKEIIKKASINHGGKKALECTGCHFTKTVKTKKLEPFIKLSKKKKSINKASTFKLTVKMANGDKIKYIKKSNDKIKVKKIAKNKYQIKGVKKGTSTVKVKLKSGKMAKCTVKVK